MKTIIKSGLLLTALVSAPSFAGYTFDLADESKITFGGYIKADARYIDGNIGARDYWIGSGTVLDNSQSNFAISVRETRFNTKYQHGDVTGFIEMDFDGGQGNEVISNSAHPRLRHAFIKYKNILAGQTWSTFMNTSSIVEAVDFGGPLVATAFIRQGQLRYTNGGLQIAIENPETYGGYRGTATTLNDSVPDFIAKYTFSGDWGNVAVSAVARQLRSLTNETESALGYGISGRIKTVGKDDFRFQIHAGEVGRYVGATSSLDMVGEEVEDTTSVLVSYRHFWTEDMRSNVFYGNAQNDLSDRDRSHWGVNLFKDVTKQLSFGVELGNFEMAEANADSDYFQVSAKYVL